MRVVIVHNRYRSANPSGENRVVDADIEQLRSNGVEVIEYLRASDEIDSFSLAARALVGVRPIVSPTDSLAVRRVLREHRPDLVHLHNPFPLISPWIVRTARAQGLPVVQTVHNYRHVCVNGVHFRNAAPCFDCVGKALPWPAVRGRCYQGSMARSVPMATAVVAHRRTWRLIDRFLPVGSAVADHLRGLGIPDSRIEVRRNVLVDPGAPSPLGRGALFVGRLSPEKGVSLLLDAWRRSGVGDVGETLTIAGDGELRDEVRSAAAAEPSIRYLGLLAESALAEIYRSSALVVVPSMWPEPDPIAVVSALAHGRPVIGSRLGSIPSSLQGGAGWVVDPTADAFSVALQVLRMRSDVESAAVAAREVFERERRANASPPLTEVYARVIEQHRSG